MAKSDQELDPYPHGSGSALREKGRIRIESMRIHNTGFNTMIPDTRYRVPYLLIFTLDLRVQYLYPHQDVGAIKV